MKLDEIYREVVLDHHRNPRGKHKIDRVDAQAQGVNPSCGDELSLTLQLEGEEIVDIGVESRGCAVSVAAGSMLAELLRGRSTSEARQLIAAFKQLMHGEDPPSGVDLGDMAALEGVKQFPMRIKCALLPHVTFLDALAGYEEGGSRESGKGPSNTEAP